MREGGDEHTGVIASVGVDGFADGRVLGHEAVQPARVDGLVRHYQQVAMRSELVALFHPADPGIAELTARFAATGRCSSSPTPGASSSRSGRPAPRSQPP